MPPKRVLFTLFLGVALILLGDRLRPAASSTGVPEEQFWSRKILWGSEFDMVLIGDSRTFRGLSPGRMRTILGDRRIANFGFSLAGLTRAYVDAAEARLDPASPRRAIVIGVTSHSLSAKAAGNDTYVRTWDEDHVPRGKRYFPKVFENEFRSLSKLNPLAVRLSVVFGGLLHHLRAYSPRDLHFAWMRQPTPFHEIYHEDGWVASRMRHDPRGTRERIRSLFVDNPVSPIIVEDLLAMVRELRARDIAVYAFTPPATPELEQLEEELSGFDREAFVAGLGKAGGIWMDLPEKPYVAYDGLHLNEEWALEVSEDVSRIIQAHEKRGTSARGDVAAPGTPKVR